MQEREEREGGVGGICVIKEGERAEKAPPCVTEKRVLVARVQVRVCSNVVVNSGKHRHMYVGGHWIIRGSR